MVDTREIHQAPLLKRIAALEAKLAAALRMVHNCLLVVPESEFKQDTSDWLLKHTAREARD